MYGLPELAWNLAKILFQENLDMSVLKSRFTEQVLVKDSENLNLIDCCFLRRKTECAEFLKSVLNNINKDYIDGEHTELLYTYPQLYKIESHPRIKNKNQIIEEKSHWDNIQEIVSRYGGDVTSKNYKKYMSRHKNKQVGQINVEQEKGETDDGEIDCNKNEYLDAEVDWVFGDDLKPYSKLLSEDTVNQMKDVTEKMIEAYSGKNKFFRALQFKHVIDIEIVDDVKNLDVMLDYLLTQQFLSFDVEFCELENQNKIESRKGEWNSIPKVAASIQISSCSKVYWLDSIKLHEYLYQDQNKDQHFQNLTNLDNHEYRQTEFEYNTLN